jgi:hypothetical protein
MSRHLVPARCLAPVIRQWIDRYPFERSEPEVALVTGVPEWLVEKILSGVRVNVPFCIADRLLTGLDRSYLWYTELEEWYVPPDAEDDDADHHDADERDPDDWPDDELDAQGDGRESGAAAPDICFDDGPADACAARRSVAWPASQAALGAGLVAATKMPLRAFASLGPSPTASPPR